jgi:nicotinamide riboside kinase
MKTLKTISHPDYPTANIEILKREAARVILIDENAMTPMMYSKKYDVYKIPG